MASSVIVTLIYSCILTTASITAAAPQIPNSLTFKLGLPTPKTYTGFNRTCSRSPDCNFTPENENSNLTSIRNSEKLWLLCENRICICDRNIYIAYAKSWGLKWDLERCTIGKQGPCGQSNGLNIDCQEGLNCSNESQKCVKITSSPVSMTTTITTTAPTTIERKTEFMEVVTMTTTTTEDPQIALVARINPKVFVEMDIVNTEEEKPIFFNRSCERSTDCQFKPSKTSERIWLVCEDNACVCMRFPNLLDVKDLRVEWNGTECNVGLGGPCGDDNGLRISCADGNICSDRRCSAIPHSVGLDQNCDEDLDCRDGLFCKVTGFHFHPIKHCVN